MFNNELKGAEEDVEDFMEAVKIGVVIGFIIGVLVCVGAWAVIL